MNKLAIHHSHELYPPSRLLAHTRLAQSRGFTHAMCSDHFHPWTPSQGQSGFAWSWLGAALQATTMDYGMVCAPGQRYHPAIIAQAAATLSEMFPGRLWIGLGSGEAVNESITGDPWPSKSDRQARLLECVQIMRALFAGETVSHQGLVRVHKARLYTRPARPPLIFGAAMSVETAAWVGTWADGLLTTAGTPEETRERVRAFRGSAGSYKPVYTQAGIGYAPTLTEAVEAARKNWPICGLTAEQIQDFDSPEMFERESRSLTNETVQNALRISHNADQHLDWLHQDFDAGVDRVYLHFMGENMELFLNELAPRLLESVA